MPFSPLCFVFLGCFVIVSEVRCLYLFLKCQPILAVARTNQVKWVSLAFGPVRKGLSGSRGSGGRGDNCGRTPRRQIFRGRESKPLCIAILDPSSILLPLLKVAPLKNYLLIDGGDCI